MSTAPGKIHLMVDIPIEGDGFPSPKELAARNRITDELDRRKIGHFVGAGGGMGAMDFSYLVEDEARARREIAEVIAKVLPGAEYTLDAAPGDDVEIDEDDDEGEDGEINWPRLIGCLVVLGVAVALVAWMIWAVVT